MKQSPLTDKFWDCGCDKYFIHTNGVGKCSKCGTYQMDGPSAHVRELTMPGTLCLCASVVIDKEV